MRSRFGEDKSPLVVILHHSGGQSPRRPRTESRPQPCERPQVQWCLATPGAPGVFSLPLADLPEVVAGHQPYAAPELVDVEEK